MADRISVIVPVYNVATDLPRCLDSILAQTHPNIEIIAVNDGSPDHSGEILDCYAARHPNIRVIHKENGGVTSARLRGVQEASGEWIGFVDGDDEIEPDMYARLLKNAVEYDADISHCGYQMVFSDGRVNYFHNSGIIREQDSHTAIRDLLEGTLVEPGLWNKLYRRELFQGLSRRMDSTIRINEDLLMNYYLFSNADVSVFDDWCPYHYIVRSTSASRAKLNPHQIYDPIRVKEIICQTISTALLDDARRAYINTCISVYHTLLSAGREYRDDLQKVRRLLMQEKSFFRLLGKKRSLMAQLIICAPSVYKPIYGIYCRYLQKNVYS
jgi:glycosyltransferase involved in cell wall biosynthesis